MSPFPFHSRASFSVSPALLLATLLAAAGCSGDSPSAPPNGNQSPGPPAQLVVSGGNQQSAMVGFDLPDSLTVKVSDATGKPVPGATVTWRVDSGGGALSAPSTTTGSTGLAKVRWTLGPLEGPQSASASVSGVASVTFTASGAPNTSGSGTMTAAGGAIGLPDGTRVVFPPGAVAGPVQVTLAKGNPAAFLDGPTSAERVLITATASVSEFAKPVEIRVPLPAAMTPADSTNVLVGRIDSLGVIFTHPSTIRVIDGKPFAVVETSAFSNWLYEWYAGKSPPQWAKLAVPFYSQGDTHACWAATIQMLTQAVTPNRTDALVDIIGELQLDPEDPKGGLIGGQWRFASGIANIITRRTEVKPTREAWPLGPPGVLVNVKTRIKQLVGIEGRPVLLFPTYKNHSVIVVGYDGDDFLVHDPQGVDDLPGYKARSWAAITDGAGLGHTVYLVSVPASLAQVHTPLSVNILPLSLEWVQRRKGAENPVPYAFRWDHRAPSGYSFATPLGDTVQTLPGRVAIFRLGTNKIEVINGSYEFNQVLTYSLEIGAVDEKGVDYTHTASHTVPVNGRRSFILPPVTIDTFRYNRATETEYFLISRVSGLGGAEAGQTIRFSIASVTPVLAAVTPNPAGVGQEVVIAGDGFGLIPFRNQVSFNGTEAKAADIRSWKDDTIRVAVPVGAADGPLVVYRGEVPSNAVPFTVVEMVTLGGVLPDLQLSYEGKTTLSGGGTWSFSGTRAEVSWSPGMWEEDPDVGIFKAKAGTSAQLKVTTSASIDRTTFSEVVNGYRYEYTFRLVKHVQAAPMGGASSVTRTGPDDDITVAVELNSSGGTAAFVRVTANVLYDLSVYAPDGSLSWSRENTPCVDGILAQFYVQGVP